MASRRVPKPTNIGRILKSAAKKRKTSTRGGDIAARKRKMVQFKDAVPKKREKTGGRKPVEISIQEFEDLAASVLDCPLSELATMLGISPRTLKDKIKADPKLKEAYKRGKRRARFTLRSIQATQAANGDSRMGIWLGKNHLGQNEPTSKHEITTNIELAISVDALDARLADLLAREEKTVDLVEADEGREAPTLPVPS